MNAKTALLLLLSCAASACDSTRFLIGEGDGRVVDSEEYVETSPIPGTDLDALWERSQGVLGMHAYEIDSTRTRFADRQIVTRWKESLSPARFQGSRTRAWVRFREANPGEWTAAVAVQRQRNVDIDHPTEPANAKWEEQPTDTARSAAEVILWKIESGFRLPGAGEDKPSK
jgi:hypothetical protein